MKTKSFIKRTKKGDVLRIVREHYLRNDIGAGTELLEETNVYRPEYTPLTAKAAHYLVLDTNIVLHQIDALEQSKLTNIIILSTVLDEVRGNSMKTYKRIRKLCSAQERHFYVFSNENHRDTYVERLKGESVNDRNDRAIMVATQWYHNRLKNKMKVILITNDKELIARSKKNNLNVQTIFQYAKTLKNQPEFIDLLYHPQDESSDDEDENNNNKNKQTKKTNEIKMKGNQNRSKKKTKAKKNTIYPSHYSEMKLREGISNNTLLQGVIHFNRNNFLEAHVTVEGQVKDILIKGRQRLNRTIDGDHVVVKLLSKNKWTTQSNQIIEEGGGEIETIDELNKIISKMDQNDKNKKTVVKKNQKAKGGKNKKQEFSIRPTGKVVGILKRKLRPYGGSIEIDDFTKKTGGRNENILFVPMDRKVPKIRIKTRQVDRLVGKRIVVVFDHWDQNSYYPNGHYVKTLGDIGDKEIESELILIENQVRYSPFCKEVLDCLPLKQEKWQIPPEEIKKRKDLREYNIFSIDPPGCKDIDDALHVIPLQNGNYEVGVHIADVTYFVKEGTAVDIEASERCTTVYLVDRRIDMLPPLLGENLCSLHEKVERLAFSCIWELTPQSEIVNTWYGRTVIKSKAALSYGQAQFRKDNLKMNDQISKDIRNLNMLAKNLRAKRVQDGALQLASPEVHFSLDSETQEPLDVEIYKIKEVNHLVEEFMLLANISVAKKIQATFPSSAMLRRHPSPRDGAFDNLLACLANVNCSLNIESSKALADSLDKCHLKSNPYFNTLVRILTTRCMTQAVYFSSGTVEYSDYWHYGLASPIYTHFTSPIRRYADVVVHRMLAASIGISSISKRLSNKYEVEKIAKVINHCHRMAQSASRDSISLHSLIFFKEKLMDEDGYVINVKKNAFIVLVPHYGVEGIIYVSGKDGKSKVPNYNFHFNEKKQMLISSKLKIKVFDKVKVRVESTKTVEHGGNIKIILSLLKPLRIISEYSHSFNK
ncbi:exosome complex exonuclease rrp44 [Anaeramoeba flamelloides]|uniref:Exosome complex exonuclease rrp44 n=1 Tax=Anaeramoeba flamelloides TaxID=1746091 RepID=A0AAV7ZTW4_9EUKA|nr:exosome complex exonuclease rrp44 [Anaeramoeba flamelloides]KAJ6239089.1 exosome complex exonuclease rrp44 [Anaeramoeba flamelloides]